MAQGFGVAVVVLAALGAEGQATLGTNSCRQYRQIVQLKDGEQALPSQVG
jgi:hypothetical protein